MTALRTIDEVRAAAQAAAAAWPPLTQDQADLAAALLGSSQDTDKGQAA